MKEVCDQHPCSENVSFTLREGRHRIQLVREWRMKEDKQVFG